MSLARYSFEAEIISWRGPSPFFFAPVPPAEADDIRGLSSLVTYGWGMIPVEAELVGVIFSTSLFPRDGAYLLPIKAAVRRRVGLTAGDRVVVGLTVHPAR